ncbi:hypothetical protein ACLF6K_17220 [Streptomyces xanthophaeus]|uniref:restriction endonuclease subunit S n=1 Tax=Streptomyces xanthophaeus TaxID=67385 RepID=UPI0039901BE6
MKEGSEHKLPEGWAWATVGDLLIGIEAGKSFKCHPHPAPLNSWGVIKVSAMSWGNFREQENKEVLDDAHANPLYEIKPGDVLVSRANTVDLVGAPVHVGEVRSRLLLSDKSWRLVPGSEVSRAWFTRCLSSPQVRRALSAKATGTSDSMRNVAQADLKAVKVAVPPAAEQRRIAAALDEGMARLDEVEAQLRAALSQTATLRRALLVKALAGEITAQGCSEESAEDLLKQIQVEREVAEIERKEARRAARLPKRQHPARESYDNCQESASCADGQSVLPLEFNS